LFSILTNATKVSILPYTLLTNPGVGRYFPCEISFPTASPSQLHSISHIEVDLLQLAWFMKPRPNHTKPELLAKDIYSVTKPESIHASVEPLTVRLPLPDPIIHGRFTSDHLRVRHQLRIVFHRKWFGKKVEWTEEVEIFHRDLGWESRGTQGVIEVVRGQEGDYFPNTPSQPLPSSISIADSES